MLRISPDGRWGFVVDRDGASVLVFDTTTNRLRHAIEVEHMLIEGAAAVAVATGARARRPL